MTILTASEKAFYNDLVLNEKDNGELSILSVFFYGGIADEKSTKDIIKEYFKNRYAEFFKESIILFGAERSSLVGKYHDYFWYTNEDGIISFLGTTITDVLYFMTETHTSPLADEDGYEDLEHKLKSRGLDIEEYLKKYKTICEKNGFTFDLTWDYDYEKAEEFNKLLKTLK